MPEYSVVQPQQLGLNTTGGAVELVTVTDDLSYTVRTGVGIVNNLDWWKTLPGRAIEVLAVLSGV